MISDVLQLAEHDPFRIDEYSLVLNETGWFCALKGYCVSYGIFYVIVVESYVRLSDWLLLLVWWNAKSVHVRCYLVDL